jgi:hypothetical protein
MMRYWQIASGAAGREYSKDFVRFGMAFVGGDVQVATMEKVEVGDRILLKRGLNEVVAVGEVVQRDGAHRGVDDKDWLRDFDGWDLRAYCFVDWHVPEKPVTVGGLTRATVQRVHAKELKKLAEELLSNVPPNRQRDPEPHPTQPVDDETILEFLIQQGLRPGAAEDLTVALKRIRLLAKYYYNECTWEEIREHETRTFLIVPLLVALGWAEQQIKIELPVTGRGRADVACFPGPYVGRNEECILLIESKGFSQGLDYAVDQAKEYAHHFPRCRVVLVSNGFCYKAFKRRSKGEFSTEPSAYLNLLKPQDRYPLDPDRVDGCLETLRLLLPYSQA